MRWVVACFALPLACTADFDRFAVDTDSGATGGSGGGGASQDGGSWNDAGAAGATNPSGGLGGGAGAGGLDASTAGGAGAPPDGGVIELPPCAATYSTAAGYKSLCLETAETCELAFASTVQSCEGLCAAHGGSCIDAFNITGTSCAHEDAIGCADATHSNALCICTRGCGQSPPCSGGLGCSAGQCN
jgi:hypothetical protein